MTTKIQAIEACLQFGAVYEDYPFDQNWAAIRHNGNKKTFAFVYEYRGQIRINLKAIPPLVTAWINKYPAVIPAYHMNKQNWITVILDGTLPREVIESLIADSYNLTKPKLKSAKAAERDPR